MQESKEIGPHITTKEELDALYKKVMNNKEVMDEDPNIMVQKIFFMYDAIVAMGKKEDAFKRDDEKGKREYTLSLWQQREDYKTIEVIYNQTTRYTFTIREDRGMEVKIGRYAEKSEDIYVFKKEVWSETYIEKTKTSDKTSSDEADMVINDVYEHLLDISSPKE